MEDSERRKTQEGLITNCHFRTVYSCTLSRPTVSVSNGKYRCKLLRLGIDTPLCFPVCLRWLVFYRFPARMRSTNSSPVFANLETGCGNHILKDEFIDFYGSQQRSVESKRGVMSESCFACESFQFPHVKWLIDGCNISLQ